MNSRSIFVALWHWWFGYWVDWFQTKSHTQPEISESLIVFSLKSTFILGAEKVTTFSVRLRVSLWLISDTENSVRKKVAQTLIRNIKDIGSVPSHKNQNLTSWFGQSINTAEIHPSILRRSKIELTKIFGVANFFIEGHRFEKNVEIFFAGKKK